MNIDAHIQAYERFFETLTRERLDELEALCAPDVRFRDPFNDIVGVAGFQAVLARMFADVSAPRFRVDDRATSARTAYLRWTFTCRPKRGGGEWTIIGMSQVDFDAQGRVVAHIDYWDAASQLYERLPVLGGVLRFIRRRLAA